MSSEKITIDKNFQQLINFVFETNKNIFLTGKAGTGKTTALKYIRENTKKQLAVVAPTGVAAINAGGSTIHSFFQLPFGSFDPENPKKLLDSYKFNKKRLKIFRELELLIIDEVSMVRADLLDAIDFTLKRTRRNPSAFGGVQVLLIGDMFQLPPVVRNDEWNILRQHYTSPFFFSSKIIEQETPVYLELDKIYRQKDQEFIDILNQVRDNKLDASAIASLNQHFKADLGLKELESSITLTTHNQKADTINQSAMKNLDSREFKYKAIVSGIFPEKTYPVDETLTLKKGAKVMFLRNNTEKNYFNGKIGVITEISSTSISVKCPDDYSSIEVEKEIWENIHYNLNPKTDQIEEEVKGSFEQYPLRLAWAITVHKSQGLTFDQAIIDVNEAFSAGQVYVALSRCRSLEGLILKSKIDSSSLMNNQSVVNFAKTKPKDADVAHTFATSRKKYHGELISSIFRATDLKFLGIQLENAVTQHKNNLGETAVNHFKTFTNHCLELENIDQKFQKQLAKLFHETEEIENDLHLAERIKKGSEYYLNILQKCVTLVENNPANTENKTVSDEITPTLQELWELLHKKIHLIRSLENGFNLQRYSEFKLKFQAPQKKISIYNKSSSTTEDTSNHPHAKLINQLFEVRHEIMDETNLPIYMIAKRDAILEMAKYFPQSTEEMMEIKGFGKAKVAAYGERFLEVIKTYCIDEGIKESLFDFKEQKKSKPKKEKKPTKEISKELFDQLEDIDAVAKERGLVRSTIIGHLAEYVEDGSLSIDLLLPKEKQEVISKVISENDALTNKELIEKLPEGYDYNDIKLMRVALS